MTADSWLDLREADDFDGPAFSTGVQRGLIQPIATLPLALFCPALDCAANADDTTRQQERCIRDVRADLSCC